jgi:dimethylaniline monooxygenase (N-oxide forming)
MKVCVIGAGPSGLVAAKYLCQDPDVSQVVVYESSSCLGGTFVNKVYDDTSLVSSTTLTAFSDFRFQDSTSRHVSATEYVEYLLDYAHHFHILECIQFNTTVASITTKKNSSERYVVHLKYMGNDYEEGFDAIAVCSGLHNIPIIPDARTIPNLDKFRGQVMHSSQYRNREIFHGKRVLIVGCGETAMDIAYRAAITVGPSGSVGMVVRHGFLSIPHYMGSVDKPLDVFITNLFEHAMEHPWVHSLQLRWSLSTYVIRFFLLLLGSSWGFNQWTFPVKEVKRGYHILNKSHAAMSHLNAYAKRKYGLFGRLSMWLYGESGLTPIAAFGGNGKGIKCIAHASSPSPAASSTVEFESGESFPDCDMIVFCTGYQQKFPFFADDFFSTSDDDSTPLASAVTSTTTGDEKHVKSVLSVLPPSSAASSGSRACSVSGDCVSMSGFRHANGEHTLPSRHFISDPDGPHPRIGFFGFVRPNVGAIPPMAELQVMWWLQSLKRKVKPTCPLESNGRSSKGSASSASYMLLGKKYQYGVDYGNYMHRLAEEIGAAPSLGSLFKGGGVRALFAYCQGQAHVPLFRLVGPYRSKVCWDVVRGELLDVCVDRGLLENAGLALMNCGFLGINLTAYIIELLYCYSIGFVTGRKFRGFAKYC